MSSCTKEFIAQINRKLAVTSSLTCILKQLVDGRFKPSYYFCGIAAPYIQVRTYSILLP